MNAIDAALATLQPAPVFPELYQELWWYSGSYASLSSNTGNVWCLAKGSTSPNNSATAIYTHNFPSNTLVAFEVAGALAGGTVRLYDVTSSTDITASDITSSASMTVFRSGQFTLTKGHTYAVRLVSTGSAMNVTDASLIVFPSSPLTSPSVSAISLANPSGNTLKESYYPLWVYSSSYVSTTATSASGSSLLMKGGTSFGTVSNTATQLYSLSSSWSASQKFAFEASIWNNSTGAVYATLWDRTSNTQVSSSQVTVSTNTATLVRSGSFTLNPSHTYGVCIWTSAGTVYLTKSHLVALA